MAEAFAVLSIAANIAQFLDYARKLISGGREIYSSSNGIREEHQALRIIIDDIRNLVHEVQPADSSQNLSADEIGFRKLAAECETLADELLAILKDLEVPNNARLRGLQTVRQTIRGAAKRKKLQDLQRRLAEIDVRLRERASRMLQKENYSVIISAINSPTYASKKLKMNTKLTLEEMRKNLVSTLEIQAKEALQKQQAGLSNFSKQLLAFAKEGQLVAEQQSRLQTLLFEEMEQREESIKDAHKTTLDWMFEKKKTNFMNWLETEKGVFWVKGKAGSGKSTLMKYVCNHKTTLEGLQRWAGAEQLFTASFFFWNSGYPMQKSQTGLLQSLLYQILRACPALIMKFCLPKAPRERWKRKELFEALDKVTKQTILPAKFCFFVDSLDEYEGDDEDVIALLQSLVSCPSIKICVSSRPWNSFLDVFDDSEWKLVLEDLTREDMRKYVCTMLVENEIFSRMSKYDPRCENLVPQIAQKAQGVWLWVYLVVRDLLRDLKGEEEFPLLQRRLDSFPDELERYFENIIDRIDKIHREETTRIFLVALTSIQPFPILFLHFISTEIANKDYAIQMKFSQISHQGALRVQNKWSKLLFSRCRDLLEVDHPSPIQDGIHVLDSKVDFLHRTVRDFLRDNYLDELLRRAGSEFDARSALCKTIIALSKASADSCLRDSTPSRTLWKALSKRDGDSIKFKFDWVDEVLIYARDFERTQGQSMASLLDELDRVNTVRTKSEHIHWTNHRRLTIEEDQHCTFLALTIQAGLRIYVNEKLEADKALITQKRGRPLLDYACRPKRNSTFLSLLEEEDVFDAQIVRILLEHGSDPNQMVNKNSDGETVWGIFIFSCHKTWLGQPLGKLDQGLGKGKPPANPPPGHVVDMWYESIEAMIDHGASPEVRVNTAREKTVISVHPMLRDIFGVEKAARLASRMEEVAQGNRPPTSIFWKVLGWT